MIKRKKKAKPEINTSALPDIIFMLLFFFMVVTVMRKRPVKVHLDLPAATQLVKLNHPSIHHHIYVGKHKEKIGTNKTAIQLNDKFVAVDRIGNAVRKLRLSQPEMYQDDVNTCLQADENLEMKILSDIKIELRKAEQVNLAYVAKKK